jgi:hypothetical protein
MRAIPCQRVQGSVRAVRAVRNTHVFLMDTRVVADAIGINYAMFVNPFATNAVKTTQIHSCWREDMARIEPAQRNADPARVYITLVNESLQ